jgi:hypothetical protein
VAAPKPVPSGSRRAATRNKELSARQAAHAAPQLGTKNYQRAKSAHAVPQRHPPSSIRLTPLPPSATLIRCDRPPRGGEHIHHFLKEIAMSKFSHIALALLFMSFASQAAEPVATPIKTAQPAAVATPVKIAQPAQPTAVAAPEKTTALSQQDKMRECNKQATGKKGAERKTFMKTCLSRKA